MLMMMMLLLILLMVIIKQERNLMISDDLLFKGVRMDLLRRMWFFNPPRSILNLFLSFFFFKTSSFVLFVQIYSVLPGGDGGCDGRLVDLPWEGGRKHMVRGYY